MTEGSSLPPSLENGDENTSLITESETPLRLSEEKMIEAIAIQAIQKSSKFSGPIPSPEVLEGYKTVLPDAPERILAMAEREQSHRHKLEQQQVSAYTRDIKDDRYEGRLGQIFAVTIALTAIACGTYLAINDKQISGSIISASGIGGIVTVFVKGRSPTREKDEVDQDSDSEL